MRATRGAWDDADECIDPQLVLAVLCHASAFLMEPLKLQCEVVLLRLLDADNCEVLHAIASRSFAQRLEAAAAGMMHAQQQAGSVME